MVYMNTNATRLRTLITEAGLTRIEALEKFNTAHPKLFSPYSMDTWKAYFCTPGTARWRPVSDKIVERAEKVFGPLKLKKDKK